MRSTRWDRASSKRCSTPNPRSGASTSRKLPASPSTGVARSGLSASSPVSTRPVAPSGRASELRRQLKPLQQQAEMAGSTSSSPPKPRPCRASSRPHVCARFGQKDRRQGGWDEGLIGARRPASARRTRRRGPDCRGRSRHRFARPADAEQAFRQITSTFPRRAGVPGRRRGETTDARSSLRRPVAPLAHTVDDELTRGGRACPRIAELELRERELDEAENGFREAEEDGAGSRGPSTDRRGCRRPPRRGPSARTVGRLQRA